MKNSEIRELGTKELQERLDNERSYILKMKMNHAVSSLDNPNKLSESRKDIARMLTELRQREINESQNS